MSLIEQLARYRDLGQMISFSLWPDGPSILLGYVREISADSVTFDTVDTLGRPDDECVVSFDSIYRLSESKDYVQRLLIFSEIALPDPLPKGAKTKSPKVIAKRLREAAESGESVSLVLQSNARQEFRVIRAFGKYVELDEYGDSLLAPVDRLLVQIGQVVSLEWRRPVDLLITAYWRAQNSD